MGQLFGIIPWDDSKDVFGNIGGGLADLGNGLSGAVTTATDWVADNTVEKLPAWDSSKGVTENISGGVKDGIDTVVKTVEDVAGGAFSTLKKYWYVPVIVGGVIIGYRLLTRPNPALIAALSKIRLPEN